MIKLIEVGSTSCGVCKMMKPMVEKAVSKFSPEEVNFLYINGDTEEGKKEMENLNIIDVSKVPTFFFYTQSQDASWRCVESFNGGMTLPGLVQKIKSHLA